MLDFDYKMIGEYIRNSTPESVIMIGCDSLRKERDGKATAVYATVICVRRATGTGDSVMYHGSKVFCSKIILPDYGKVERAGKLKNLKTRLMQEVTFALEAYGGIYEAIGDRQFEIHLDINSRPEYDSHIAMNDAKGYVLGVSGKEPEFKPYALAASFAADAHGRGLLN
jgi:predicted RNase H-related nuclease YkuK (DUF458 family)